jgi:O-antigen ligase
MRVYALWLVVFVLSVYAWKDWYKSLCGLIVLMAVLEHKDVPRTIFDVPGLNPWNLVFFIVLMAWMVQRQREQLRWDIPKVPATLLLLGVGVLLFGAARLAADRQHLIDELSITGLLSDYVFNPMKWVVVGLMLFDGCRTRRRLVLGLASILALYFLISLQVIRWVVPSGALDGGELSSYTVRMLQRETGYHRNDLSTMLAGASWALLAMLPLVRSTRDKVGILLPSFVVLFAQVLTGGRGGYLAWCSVGLTLGLVRWRRYLVLAPLIVSLFLSLVPSAADRALQGLTQNRENGSGEIDLEEFTAGRNLLWPQVIDKIWDAPLIGYGRAAMQRTGLSAWYAASQGGEGALIHHPHNAYLEMLLDNGIVGLLVALALYGYLLTTALSLVRDRGNSVFLAVGGLALSLILAQLVGSFTGQSLYPREPTVGMWCAIGLLLRVSVERSTSTRALYPIRMQSSLHTPDMNIQPGATAGTPVIQSIRHDQPWWRSGLTSRHW